MNLKWHQLFFASLYEPKKMAAFRLLPIGKVFKYVFVFIFLFTFISFGRFLFGDIDVFETTEEVLEYGETLGALRYPISFMLSFTITVFYIFIRLSAMAFVGLGLLRIMKRRGEYRHIWQSTAFAMTVPLFIQLIFEVFPSLPTEGKVISYIVHLLYMFAIVRYYPKLPKR